MAAESPQSDVRALDPLIAVLADALRLLGADGRPADANRLVGTSRCAASTQPRPSGSTR